MSKSIVDALEEELGKSDKIKDNIEKSMGPGNTTSNEVKAIKAKFANLMYSAKLIKDEKDAMKELFKILKDEHAIHPKVAKKVQKLLDEGSVTAFEEEQLLIQQVYEKLRS